MSELASLKEASKEPDLHERRRRRRHAAEHAEAEVADAAKHAQLQRQHVERRSARQHVERRSIDAPGLSEILPVVRGLLICGAELREMPEMPRLTSPGSQARLDGMLRGTM